MMHRHFARPLAAAAVLVLAACQDAASPTTPSTLQPDESPSMARSAQAQARLEAIFQRTSPEVMALPGTVFADHDEVAGRVVIGVENIGVVRGVQNAMQRLGIADADYAVELTAPIQAMQAPATLQSKARPTIAGIQINFGGYVCTLGFNVRIGDRDAFVTNSHCTNTQGGTEGTQYWQPSRTSEPTAIATEAIDPEFKRGGASCPKGKRCRASDASLAYYATGFGNTLGAIARTTGVNTTTLNVAATGFTITSALEGGADAVKTGETVNKVGRTTGWSRGAVTRTCANTSVQGSTVYLLCQNFVSATVGGGDSGSPVFQESGNGTARLVGILWGGSGSTTFVYSPLNAINSELGGFTTH